jgi:hypothetical protein
MRVKLKRWRKTYGNNVVNLQLSSTAAGNARGLFEQMGGPELAPLRGALPQLENVSGPEPERQQLLEEFKKLRHGCIAGFRPA